MLFIDKVFFLGKVERIMVFVPVILRIIGTIYLKVFGRFIEHRVDVSN